MKIIPLNEGTYAASKQKVFTRLTLGNSNQMDAKSLKMGICPFLIVLQDDIILLDTGLGFTDNTTPILFPLLEKAGYTPSQITKVLVSHLHKDHIDGIGHFSDTGFVQNFPNAVIHIQKKELEYSLKQKDNPSFNQDVLKELSVLTNIELMTKDEGMINEHISFQITGGHSPFHQVFWIKEEQKTLFYGADNLPQKSYLKFHVAYKTDFDGKKAMELRQEWEQKAKQDNWTVLFYHDTTENIVDF